MGHEQIVCIKSLNRSYFCRSKQDEDVEHIVSSFHLFIKSHLNPPRVVVIP